MTSGFAFGRGTTITLLTVAATAIACAQQASEPAAPPPPAPPPPVPAAPAAVAAPTAPAAAAPAAASAPPTLPEPVVLKDVGLATPESVLYDPKEDVYLVSNVNGKPLDTDGNGFISKVTPDGKVQDLKWIDGAKPQVTLNAPKGMALSGPYLYVADITWVRLFHRKTGKPAGKFAVPGATFANDLAAAPDGTVYVSDTGWKAGADGFESTGTDAVFSMQGGPAKKLFADQSLGSPNGVLADDDGVWYVTASGELGRITGDGEKKETQKLPSGGLDGIVKLADGSIAVSSWKGSAVYRGTPGGEFSPLIQNVAAPADIGYDSKRNRVLIPMFNDDTVRIQPLPSLPAPKQAAATPRAEPGAAPAAAPVAKSSSATASPAKPAATPPAATPGNPPSTAATPPAAVQK